MKLIQNYIDGHFVSGKDKFADLNPADGTEIAQVTEATKAQVDEAVHAARFALRGEWGLFGVQERAMRLHRIADAIEKRFDCFVQAEVADTGKPISLASKLDVPRAAANFRVFADLMKMSGLESFQTETPDGAGALNYAVRKPLGVIGVITPWNLPLLLLTWKVAPALACGTLWSSSLQKKLLPRRRCLRKRCKMPESPTESTTLCMASVRGLPENF